MTNLEKKEELEKYRLAGLEITRLENEILRWRSVAERMTASSGGAPGGGGDGRSLEHAVARIDILVARLEADRTELVELRLRLRDVLRTVPDYRLRLLLRFRYIDGVPLEKVAEKLNVGYRQVVRMHSEALTALCLEEIFEMSLNVLRKSDKV